MTDSPRVLVAFGSRRGGTEGLAYMIGSALAEAGCEAVVARAGNLTGVTDVDAVIVAGSLYANRWHRQARRFVRRYADTLRGLPVWLVSSGPLDDSAGHEDIAPTKQVAELAALVQARGEKTFGGRLSPDATGFPARAMAKTHAGDWRDPAAVKAWVDSIAAQIRSA